MEENKKQNIGVRYEDVFYNIKRKYNIMYVKQ